MSGPLLSVQDLTLRFGAIVAFADIGFDVGEGELFAMIGPNGAGKTSVFNVLSRVYHADTGRVLYRGADLLRLRPRELAGAGIARTFQNLGLYGPLTVLENVLLGRHHLMRSGMMRGGMYLGFARAEEARHRERVREVLAFCGIERVADTPVAALPYGVRKLVELARALAMEPQLVLLDEPVAGMSSAERDAVTDLVRRMHRERGLTVMLVEHDMGMVMQIAQRVLVLDFGRSIALGTPADVQRDPAVVKAYLGEALEETA